MCLYIDRTLRCIIKQKSTVEKYMCWVLIFKNKYRYRCIGMYRKSSGKIHTKLLRWFQLKREAGEGSWINKEKLSHLLYTLLHYLNFSKEFSRTN